MKTILVVDDEFIILQFLEEYLTEKGYLVITRMDGLAALEIFKTMNTDIDLIITDYTMPGIDGLELATECKKIKPKIPIILSTGYAKKINKASFEKAGINKIIEKPASLQFIADAIEKLTS